MPLFILFVCHLFCNVSNYFLKSKKNLFKYFSGTKIEEKTIPVHESGEVAITHPTITVCPNNIVSGVSNDNYQLWCKRFLIQNEPI